MFFEPACIWFSLKSIMWFFFPIDKVLDIYYSGCNFLKTSSSPILVLQRISPFYIASSCLCRAVPSNGFRSDNFILIDSTKARIRREEWVETLTIFSRPYLCSSLDGLSGLFLAFICLIFMVRFSTVVNIFNGCKAFQTNTV